MSIREILSDNQNNIAKVILSKSKNEFIKIVCKPILLKNEKLWQIEKFTKQQVFHLNLDFDNFVKFVEDNFAINYMQINVLTASGEITGLCSKSGKVTFNKNSKSKTIVEVQQHNKQKNYLLSEGMDIPVLRDLGIFTMDNKVVQSMYDKFKQINRFVEILDDAFCNYDREDITILDFGCGKSYLTFVVYYYFVYIKGIKAKVIGYDLKQDVVNNCNYLAKKIQLY